MEKVLGVEDDVSAFYRRAVELTRDDEVRRTFESLLKNKASTTASLRNRNFSSGTSSITRSSSNGTCCCST
jgi:hypothetical protein